MTSGRVPEAFDAVAHTACPIASATVGVTIANRAADGQEEDSSGEAGEKVGVESANRRNAFPQLVFATPRPMPLRPIAPWSETPKSPAMHPGCFGGPHLVDASVWGSVTQGHGTHLNIRMTRSMLLGQAAGATIRVPPLTLLPVVGPSVSGRVSESSTSSGIGQRTRQEAEHESKRRAQ